MAIENSKRTRLFFDYEGREKIIRITTQIRAISIFRAFVALPVFMVIDTFLFSFLKQAVNAASILTITLVLFLLVSMSGWLAVIGYLAWSFAGSEVVKFLNRGISLETRLFGLRWKSSHRFYDMENLRFDEHDAVVASERKTSFSFGCPVIKFDDGAKTVSFGRDLSRSDAHIIMDEIAKAASLHWFRPGLNDYKPNPFWRSYGRGVVPV